MQINDKFHSKKDKQIFFAVLAVILAVPLAIHWMLGIMFGLFMALLVLVMLKTPGKITVFGGGCNAQAPLGLNEYENANRAPLEMMGSNQSMPDAQRNYEFSTTTLYLHQGGEINPLPSGGLPIVNY